MEENKKTVGLITYHSAYNFGSVLQAYATKKAIEQLGFNVETIDYRTKSQTYWYTTETSSKLYGKRLWLWDMQFYLIRSARLRRRKKFEDFIFRYLNLTKPTLRTYQDIIKANFHYDALVCGSDQIWNPFCLEFFNENKEEALLPYFLKFGTATKRIAYASSFNTFKRVIVEGVKNLNNIDVLSVREEETARIVSELTGRQVTHVCDPTLLLKPAEYDFDGNYKPSIGGEYLLIYNLIWTPKEIKKWLPAIKEFAEKHSWKIVLISPLHFFSDKEVVVLNDAGPIDFISYLKNASFVVTTTFHGTMFSLNFERPFVSCSTNLESRQGQILRMCGTSESIVSDVESFQNIAEKMVNVDFAESQSILDKFRRSSFEYITNALTL